MRQLKGAPIVEADLIEFLTTESNFAFEVNVLRTLIDVGLSCEHSGTYDDPATKKPRQFDIRATKNDGNRFLRLAVEVKNIGVNFPLLISCLPRRDEEALHEILFSVNPDKHSLDPPDAPALTSAKSIHMTGSDSIYRSGEQVGKTCDQVGRNLKGELYFDDSGVFDKWSQALGSSADLFLQAWREGGESVYDRAISLILPIVVVPDGRLWNVQYNADGTRTENPRQVDRCSLFVGKTYSSGNTAFDSTFTISHLEFVTFGGLVAFAKQLLARMELLLSWDRIDAILDELDFRV